MNQWWFVRLTRAVPFLGALLLACVNLHLCAPRYELPGGATCVVCPTLDDGPTDLVAEIGERHGDCHDCCVIAACHDSEPETAVTATTSWEPVFALHGANARLELDEVVRAGRPSVHLGGCPPTGPPRSGRPRSPPLSFSA